MTTPAVLACIAIACVIGYLARPVIEALGAIGVPATLAVKRGPGRPPGKPRKPMPIQYCPVPGCANRAAPGVRDALRGPQGDTEACGEEVPSGPTGGKGAGEIAMIREGDETQAAYRTARLMRGTS